MKPSAQVVPLATIGLGPSVKKKLDFCEQFKLSYRVMLTESWLGAKNPEG